jgi:Asp/Glu/hydantoin racemase
MKTRMGSSGIALNRRSAPVIGFGIGVLHIESRYPLVRGHLQNARSLGIPLCYECVQGITPRQVVACDPRVEKPLLAAGRALKERGVSAVIGTCGSFVNFQSVLVAALDIPVFSSVMLVVPLLLRSMPKSRKLLIVFATAASFTERVAREAGITQRSRLVIADCKDLPAFAPILENQPTLDSDALRDQLVHRIGTALKADPAIGQIVFQCSELAPYASVVREHFGLPVFDINSLALWVDRSIAERS